MGTQRWRRGGWAIEEEGEIACIDGCGEYGLDGISKTQSWRCREIIVDG